MNYQEHYLQQSCFNWLRATYPTIGNLAYAVPNGQHRTAAQAAVLKSEGMTKGVSDICIDIPSHEYHSLRIEMKTDKGKQTIEQEEYELRCKAVGIKYVVVRSRDEFEAAVNEHMAHVSTAILFSLGIVNETMAKKLQDAQRSKTARELKRLNKGGRPSSKTEEARKELNAFLAKHA